MQLDVAVAAGFCAGSLHSSVFRGVVLMWVLGLAGWAGCLLTAFCLS